MIEFFRKKDIVKAKMTYLNPKLPNQPVWSIEVVSSTLMDNKKRIEAYKEMAKFLKELIEKEEYNGQK